MPTPLTISTLELARVAADHRRIEQCRGLAAFSFAWQRRMRRRRGAGIIGTVGGMESFGLIGIICPGPLLTR